MTHPAKGQAALDADALAKATRQLELALQVNKVEIPAYIVREAIARGVIREYLKHKQTKPRGIRAHPGTIALTTMNVGDVILLDEEISPQTARSRMHTARGLMNNPAARWVAIIQPSGRLAIERLPDGTHPKKMPWHNKTAVFLASLAIGQTATTTLTRHLEISSKAAARRILKKSTAQWKTMTTNKGLRVTRIA